MLLADSEWTPTDIIKLVTEISTLVGVVLAYLKSLDNASKIDATNTKIDANAVEVKETLIIADQKKTDHLNAQDQKLKLLTDVVHEVKGDMTEVKINTNGLVEKAKATSEEKGFNLGVKSETDKTAPPGTH